jgi:hypothetical protein
MNHHTLQEPHEGEAKNHGHVCDEIGGSGVIKLVSFTVTIFL